jgi:hypothetical protein
MAGGPVLKEAGHDDVGNKNLRNFEKSVREQNVSFDFLCNFCLKYLSF